MNEKKQLQQPAVLPHGDIWRKTKTKRLLQCYHIT